MNKTLDKSGKYDKIPEKNAYSLIKSGGGIGPMKPGNLQRIALSFLCVVPNPTATRDEDSI